MNCLYCKKEIAKRKKYCNNQCQRDYEYHQYIDDWLKGEKLGNRGEQVSAYIRRWIFERAKNQCEICGWSKINQFTGNVPLSVHHKDGNSENTRPENIELICPNCHSLTATYGVLNKGKGRKNRLNKIKILGR